MQRPRACGQMSGRRRRPAAPVTTASTRTPVDVGVRLDHLVHELQQAHAARGPRRWLLGRLGQARAGSRGSARPGRSAARRPRARCRSGASRAISLATIGDGGQRRAQLVGGGGGQRAQGRQPLFARQHRLGDVERQLHARRLAGRLPGIAGGEGDAGDHGERRADPVAAAAGRSVRPAATAAAGTQKASSSARQHRPGRPATSAWRSGRVAAARVTGAISSRQNGLAVPAGQEEQRAELQDVEGRAGRRPRGRRPPAGRARRRRSAGSARPPAPITAKHSGVGRRGSRSTRPTTSSSSASPADHQPAQGDQGADPQAAAAATASPASRLGRRLARPAAAALSRPRRLRGRLRVADRPWPRQDRRARDALTSPKAATP